jgi:hypothetical protein
MRQDGIRWSGKSQIVVYPPQTIEGGDIEMAGFAGEYNTGFEVYDGAIVITTSGGEDVEIDYTNVKDIIDTLREAGQRIAAADGDTLDDYQAVLLQTQPGKVTGGVRLPWPGEDHPGDMAAVFGVGDLKGERMSAADAANLVQHLLQEEEEDAAFAEEDEDLGAEEL